MNFRIDYEPQKKKITTEKRKICIKRKLVALTGSLPGMNRSQARQWIESRGASYHDVVTTLTHYVIVGKSTRPKKSTKVLTAEKLGIPMITYGDIA
jgi:NAD-dependent DNA ligase